MGNRSGWVGDGVRGLHGCVLPGDVGPGRSGRGSWGVHVEWNGGTAGPDEPNGPVSWQRCVGRGVKGNACRWQGTTCLVIELGLPWGQRRRGALCRMPADSRFGTGEPHIVVVDCEKVWCCGRRC